MSGHKQLGLAKEQKNDEFYTQLSDIEKELRYYKRHFAGKTVLCNCDDPFESNFFKYFVLNFNRLGLKKLICTSYVSSPIRGTIFEYFDDTGNDKKPYKAVVTTVYDKTGDGSVDMLDIAELFRSGENELTELEGDGDFRSAECIELLKEADIVVTNPPFSLFREYVAQLMKYQKEFIIIGALNAVKYKEIFPLLRDNKIWLGATMFNGGATHFIAPPDLYDESKMSNPKNAYWKDGKFYWRVNGVRWFTNLDIKRRHEEIILCKKYTPEAYPHYTNLDAIDINSISDIPCDYAGWMGVPINIMDCYNPDQFELVGTSTGDLGKAIGVTPNHRGRTDVAYIGADGKPKCPYQRFIVRNKHPEEAL